MDYELKDSGKRAQYDTGAQRDTREGKGRYDLISPIAARRLALVLEKGAVKYDTRNWEKGIPLGRLLDSASRHLNQYLAGYRDEDHLGHAFFNIMAAIHTEEKIIDGDLPISLIAELPECVIKDIMKMTADKKREEKMPEKPVSSDRILMRCPKCGSHHLQKHDLDLEKVKCCTCGWITDYYEAMKAAEKNR